MSTLIARIPSAVRAGWFRAGALALLAVGVWGWSLRAQAAIEPLPQTKLEHFSIGWYADTLLRDEAQPYLDRGPLPLGLSKSAWRAGGEFPIGNP